MAQSKISLLFPVDNYTNITCSACCLLDIIIFIYDLKRLYIMEAAIFHELFRASQK